MSTRGFLIRATDAQRESSTYEAVYLHSTSSRTIDVLRQYYWGAGTQNDLFALGSLSKLGKDIGEKIDFDAWCELAYDKQCLAYHRDRGDDLEILKGNTLAQILDTIHSTYGDTEITYLWNDMEWIVIEGAYAHGY